MRDAITESERAILVRLTKAGVPWEQVRTSLREVNPEALDANFKEWVFEKAGIEAEEDEAVVLEEKAKAEEKLAEAQAKLDTAAGVKAAAKAAKEAAKAAREAEAQAKADEAARLAAEEAELEAATRPDPLG